MKKASYVISIDKTTIEIRDSTSQGKVLLNVYCKDLKFDPSDNIQLEGFENKLFDFIFKLFISKEKLEE